MPRYANKCAVVIGGTSGLGLATAKLLVAEGARVLATGNSKEAVQSAQAALGDGGIAVVSDITAFDAIDTLVERVRRELGQIHLLSVSAGINDIAPLDQLIEDQYDKVMSLNAKGPLFTVQKLVSLMAEGGGIVLTTSVSNVKGAPGTAAYSASKAALRSMARTLAGELVGRGIRVNAVSPGPIDTGILEKSLGKEGAEKARAQFIERNPMHRFGNPDEVAKAILFLGFEATFTTGAELPVDGGTSQL